MTTTERYNGWKNYETWNVALWLDNDEGSHDYWLDRAEEAYRDSEADQTFTRMERARYQLADKLKDDIAEENKPEVHGLYADLLSAALSEVDWDEIATHYLDEVYEDVDKEEVEEVE